MSAALGCMLAVPGCRNKAAPSVPDATTEAACPPAAPLERPPKQINFDLPIRSGVGLRPARAPQALDDNVPGASSGEVHWGASWIRVVTGGTGLSIRASGTPTTQVQRDVAPYEPERAALAWSIGEAVRSGSELWVGVEVHQEEGGASEHWFNELYVFALPASQGGGAARFVGSAVVSGHEHITAGAAVDYGGDVIVTES